MHDEFGMHVSDGLHDLFRVELNSGLFEFAILVDVLVEWYARYVLHDERNDLVELDLHAQKPIKLFKIISKFIY